MPGHVPIRVKVSGAARVGCNSGESPVVNMGLNIEIPVLHFVEAILAFQKGGQEGGGVPAAGAQPPAPMGLDQQMWTPLGQQGPPSKADVTASRMNASQPQRSGVGVSPPQPEMWGNKVPRAEALPMPPLSFKSAAAGGAIAKESGPGNGSTGKDQTDKQREMHFTLTLSANRPMGITLDMQSKGSNGWPIRKIEHNSWAQENFLEVDDRLVAINGKPVCEMSKIAIQNAMGQRPVGFKFQRIGGQQMPIPGSQQMQSGPVAPAAATQGAQPVATELQQQAAPPALTDGGGPPGLQKAGEAAADGAEGLGGEMTTEAADDATGADGTADGNADEKSGKGAHGETMSNSSSWSSA